MGQSSTRPEADTCGTVTVAKQTFSGNLLKSTLEAPIFWTIFCTQDQFEECRRGTYFRSQVFSICHPFWGYQMTHWRLRVYPHGEVGSDRGVSLYLEPLSTDFGVMNFSAVPMRMAGGPLDDLHAGYDADKFLSRDGEALGFCIGGFRQVLESVKRTHLQDTDALYVTFKLVIKLDY